MRSEKKFFAELDYYGIFKIEPGATSIEVEEAFQNLSKGLNLNHPDTEARKQAAEKLLHLTQAYEVLHNPIQRSAYDLRVFGRKNLPINFKIEGLFTEAIKAYRQKKNDLALRYFKEIIHLFPHRSLYRIHLAILYAERGWKAFCEAELSTALKLNSKDEFAQETVARLLFNMPDHKVERLEVTHRMYRQTAMMAASFVVITGLLLTGLPQRAASVAMAKVSSAQQVMGKKAKHSDYSKEPAIVEDQKQLPEEVQQKMTQKQQTQDEKIKNVNIEKFDSNYQPEGKAYDYTHLKAVEKTYYPEQQIVVVNYEDGTVLTYRPDELKGWKEDNKTNQTVVITRDNEIIPSPSTLPLSLPNGSKADMNSSDIPTNLFPEYGNATSTSTSTTAESTPSDTPVYNQTEGGTVPPVTTSGV